MSVCDHDQLVLLAADASLIDVTVGKRGDGTVRRRLSSRRATRRASLVANWEPATSAPQPTSSLFHPPLLIVNSLHSPQLALFAADVVGTLRVPSFASVRVLGLTAHGVCLLQRGISSFFRRSFRWAYRPDSSCERLVGGIGKIYAFDQLTEQ